MRAAIDLTPLQEGSSGGLVQHMENLLPWVFSLDPQSTYWVFHSDTGYRFSGAVPGNVTVVSLPSDALAARLDEMLAELQVAALFRVFPPEQDSSFPWMQQLVFVPDLQYEVQPEFFSDHELFQRRRSFRRAIYKAGAIGLSSEFSRRELHRLFPDTAPPVCFMPPVLPQRMAFHDEPLTNEQQRLLPAAPFFLYPANCWPHKNHRRLLEAFQQFLSRVPAFELILTGDPAGWAGIKDQFASLPVRHLGYVRPALLAELYRRAMALVFFSLYEGFGIPLLEAFHWGAPVLCSDRGSLPGVGGDAVLYCDPLDVSAMADLMERIVRSPDLRAAFIARGRDRLTRFDGAQSARQLIGALHAVAQAANGRAGQRQNRLPPSDGTMALQARGDDPFLFTLVLPLLDHRGYGMAVIQSWAQQQTLPRARYEIIFLGNGKETALEEAVQNCLSPQDRFVRRDGDDYIQMYDIGARQARGRWLFFTEPHAFGEPECLEAMARYLEWTRYPGAFCQSLPVDENELARMEELAFEEVGESLRMQPEHWSHFFLRGSALDRTLYILEGGLQWQYGLFAEPVLSASWHHRGHKIGYARQARIRHVNTGTLTDLRKSVQNYTRGEWQFFVDAPAWPWHDYFPIVDLQRAKDRLQMARDLRRSLSRSLVLPRINVLCTARRFVQLLRCWPDSLGPGWWRRQVRARYWWAVWRYRFCRNTRKYAAYQEINRAIVAATRIELLMSHSGGEQSQERCPRSEYLLADLSSEWLSGFYPLELHQQTRFRWSGPTACLLLPLDPDKEVLELQMLAGVASKKPFDVFLNGLPLRRLAKRDNRSWYRLPQSAWTDRPTQTITLLVDGYRPSDSGLADTRSLGLPLVCLRQWRWSEWEQGLVNANGTKF